MKQGFEVKVQSDLSPALKNEAIKWAINWGETHRETGYGLGKVAGSDRKTYFNRGVFGMWLDDIPTFPFKDSQLVFRRISRNRRVFGVVHVNTLERVDGEPIEINQCMCPQHRGGQRVKFKKRPQMETVFTWGEIKG